MLQYLRLFNFIQKLPFAFSKEAGTKYAVFPKMVILLKFIDYFISGYIISYTNNR